MSSYQLFEALDVVLDVGLFPDVDEDPSPFDGFQAVHHHEKCVCGSQSALFFSTSVLDSESMVSMVSCFLSLMRLLMSPVAVKCLCCSSSPRVTAV